MAVNIVPYRVLGVTTIEGKLGTKEYMIIETVSNFDSLYHFGDLEFATAVPFTAYPAETVDPGVKYFRPSSFEESVNWVLDTDSMLPGDKPRLLNLLNAMEEDPLLHICFEYSNQYKRKRIKPDGEI